MYDIKNLKLKIRSEGDHQYNSPWNIAAKFNIDMSFSTGQIADMLEEYEADHRTGMDVEMIADEVYQYTSGYPYLVSAICKYLDEEVPDKKGFENPADVWTKRGVDAAVKILLNENIPLFDSMIKQLDAYRDMRDMIEQILYQSRQIPFSPAEKSINLGLMFGFLKEEDGHIAVANRIFEMYLLNMFMTEESTKSDALRQGQSDKKKQNLNFLERRCLMITCGSIYIIVKDFDKSVQFYKLLLERDVTAQNMNRFAIFNQKEGLIPRSLLRNKPMTSEASLGLIPRSLLRGVSLLKACVSQL